MQDLVRPEVSSDAPTAARRQISLAAQKTLSVTGPRAGKTMQASAGI